MLILGHYEPYAMKIDKTLQTNYTAKGHESTASLQLATKPAISDKDLRQKDWESHTCTVRATTRESTVLLFIVSNPDPGESATLNRDPIKPTKQVLHPTADSCPFFCLMKVVESTASYISLTSRLTIDPSRNQPSADKNNHQPRR